MSAPTDAVFAIGGIYLAIWQRPSTDGASHDHFGFVRMPSAAGRGSTAFRLLSNSQRCVALMHDAIPSAADAALCYFLLGRTRVHAQRVQDVIRNALVPPDVGRACQCWAWVAVVLTRLHAEGLVPCRSLQELRDELSMHLTALKARTRRGAMRQCERVAFQCCDYR